MDIEPGQIIALSLIAPEDCNFGLYLLSPEGKKRSSARKNEAARSLEYVSNEAGKWFIKIARYKGEGRYEFSARVSGEGSPPAATGGVSGNESSSGEKKDEIPITASRAAPPPPETRDDIVTDRGAAVQYSIIKAKNGDHIPFRASFEAEPVVITSAVTGNGQVVLCSPANISGGSFDIIINDLFGNSVDGAVVHWIAFVPDSRSRCLGGTTETGGHDNNYIPFDAPLQMENGESIVVLTNVEKNRAYLSGASRADTRGFNLWASDASGAPVMGTVHWVAVIPGPDNGFIGASEFMDNGNVIEFDEPWVNPCACVGSCATPQTAAGVADSNPTDFKMSLSSDQAQVNWLACGNPLSPVQAGQIEIVSIPEGATIFLDETQQGTTPLVIPDLLPGTYRVRLSLEGYNDIETAIVVRPQETSLVEKDLTLTPGTLQVSSHPPGAVIKIDGSSRFPFYWDNESHQYVHPEYGETGSQRVVLYPVHPDEHTLSLHLDNYATWTETHDLEPGGTWIVDARLDPSPGSLSITTTPAGANITVIPGTATDTVSSNQGWIEGGQTDPENGSLTLQDLAPGTYTVKASLPYYQDTLKTVVVSSNQTSNTQLDLPPATGSVRIIVKNEFNEPVEGAGAAISPCPANAPCSIGPTDAGGRARATLNAGLYTLTITKNGYEEYNIDIEVASEYTYQDPLDIISVLTETPGNTDASSSTDTGQDTLRPTVTDDQGNVISGEAGVYTADTGQLLFSHPSGCLTVSADRAVVGDHEMTYSGNVLLNGFLGITGPVTVEDDPEAAVTAQGDAVTGYGAVDTAIAGANSGDSFLIEPASSDVGGCYHPLSGNLSTFSFSYYGLDFEVDSPRLYDNRLTLSGNLSPFWEALPEIGVGFSVSPSGLDFGGRIELPNFSIGNFGVNDAFLELDTGCGNCWSAGITFCLPPGVGIEVGGELGILNGSISRVSASAGNLSLPVGNSGVFLGSINGGLENIPPHPDPLILSAGAGFYAGPKIPATGEMPGFDLAGITFGGGDFHLLGGDVDLSFDCSGKMSAEGNAYILDPGFGKIGSAEMVLDLNRGFYLDGELQNPPGNLAILKGALSGKLDFDLEFQASVTGTLQAPDALSIIGGMHFGQAVGYIDNDLIAAGVSIGKRVCVPIVGCYDFSIDVCLILPFDDPGLEVATNWDAIQEVELTQGSQQIARSDGDPQQATGTARTQDIPVQMAGLSIPFSGTFNLFSLFSASYENDQMSAEIPDGLDVAIFHLQHLNRERLPEFSITSPDGQMYDFNSEAVMGHCNSDTAECWYAVPHPAPGQWIITPGRGLRPDELQLNVYRLNQKPEMVFTAPNHDITVDVGRPVTIGWHAEDPDNSAQIRICYTESLLQTGTRSMPAFPGNTIIKGLSEDHSKSTYTWNTQGVAPGRYYLYAVITDNQNFPVFVWNDRPVTIREKTFLPPEKISAQPGGDRIHIQWEETPGADGYHIYYQADDEKRPMILSPQRAVWQDTGVELDHLDPGKRYRISISAFRKNGFESALSTPVDVILR